MKTTLFISCLFFAVSVKAQSPSQSSPAQLSVTAGNSPANLDQPRKFCEVLATQVDYGMKSKDNQASGTKIQYNVGTKFILDYEDHTTNTFYAAAVWEGNSALVINTAKKVLEDVDAFFNRNSLANCGDPNQRMIVHLTPYIQAWVTNSQYTTALGVASQAALASDLNYVNQSCPFLTPNVHLAFSNAPVGSLNNTNIGYIYLNPATTNFNLNYPTAPSSGEFDLYSVILHELTHILGINVNDYRFRELLYSGGTPINTPGVFSCADNPNFLTLATAGCTAVSCIGDYTNDPVYAPAIWEEGSSLSHFPDVCSGSPLGNNVMNPGISLGQMKRSYHQREVNALQDLGYNFTNPFNGVSYTLHNTNYVVGNSDGILVQPMLDELTSCDLSDYHPIVHTICDTWPLVLSPLTNDINATLVQEVVVKTGNANASVAITGANNDQLSFTATVPGIYTLAYIPASANRAGLPTYIQVNVPACGESGLDPVTCNDDPNCNQICPEYDVFEHTLLYGDSYIQPSFYPDDSFEINCRKNLTGVNEPSYTSVFFWVNTDPSQDYTLSFKRTYTESGTSAPNPDVKVYAFLVKSADMLNGQYSQSGNYFPSLPANRQLVYEELFTAGSYPATTVSFCFTANNNYDMLVFYTEQVTNLNSSRIGKVKIQNLEFMKKEVPNLPNVLSACIPESLNLGETFCAATTNTFAWTSQNNTVLTTGQVYSQDNITTPLEDQYTFTMTYPALPPTVITPAGNASCTISHTVGIHFVECCAGATQPVIHPLTAFSTGRTFGVDVDGDVNGAVYYTGAMDPMVSFGPLSVSCVAPTVEGFVVKIDDYCANWLVRTPFINSKIEVSDDGRIFYLGATDYNYRYKYLANYNSANGSVVWSWNTPSAAVITDFALDEAAARIIITGRMTGSFNYNGTPITGTADDIFVIRLNYGGVYQGHVVIAAAGSFTESRIAVKNSNLVVAYPVSTSQWKLSKLNYTSLVLLSTPSTVPITSGGGNFVFNALEYDGGTNSVMAQLIYYTNVTYGGGATALTNSTGLAKTGYIKADGNTFALTGSGFLSNVVFGFSYTNGADMDMLNGRAVFTYVNDIGEMHVKLINVSTGATIWDKLSDGVTTSDWLGTKGVKSTPSGVYNTGCFYHNVLIDNTTVITSNTSPTTFYGIRYNETSGAITTLALHDGTSEYVNDNLQLETLDVNSLTDDKTGWVSLFPNPGKGLFTIKAEGSYRITVRDIHGKVVSEFEGTDQSKFDISERSNGIYLIEITGDRGTRVLKLLKE